MKLGAFDFAPRVRAGIRRSARLFLYAALSLLTVAVESGPAFTRGNVEFERLYADLRTEMDSGRSDAIRALLAKDFRSIDVHGNVTDAAAMLAKLGGVPVPRSKERTTTVNSVRLKGRTALVLQSYSSSFRMAGSDGVIHRMHIGTRSNDIWIKSGTRWLLQRTETRAMIVETDGKQVTHIDLDDKLNSTFGSGG